MQITIGNNVYFFRHPRHRKYLIRICDEIHDLRCEKNCPVIILYSLGDNAFKVLMWLNIPADNICTEEQRDTASICIFMFCDMVCIRCWCWKFCKFWRIIAWPTTSIKQHYYELNDHLVSRTLCIPFCSVLPVCDVEKYNILIENVLHSMLCRAHQFCEY